MKKQLFSIALAGILLAMSAGCVQAKEIKKPVQMKKPAINKVVNRNTNYYNHHKYITKANKKHNNKFAFNKSKAPKYNNRITKAQKPKYNYAPKNKTFNKNNLTAQNKGILKNNYPVNTTNTVPIQKQPAFPQNIGKIGV